MKPPSLTVIAGHIQSHGLSPMSAAITLTSVSNFTLQFLVSHVGPGAAHGVGWFFFVFETPRGSSPYPA